MVNIKKVLPALSVCAILSGLVTFGAVKLTAAYFENAETHVNNVSYGNNTTKIEEPDFTPDVKIDEGVNVYKKSVSIKNTGNTNAYIRIMLEFSDPAAEAVSEYTNSKGTFPASKLAENLPDGWVKGTGALSDYYYYTTPVAPGKSTTAIINQVKTTFESKKEKFDYDIYVKSESVQTKYTVDGVTKDFTWEEAWNSKVS